jgi:hypothetical protein
MEEGYSDDTGFHRRLDRQPKPGGGTAEIGKHFLCLLLQN